MKTFDVQSIGIDVPSALAFDFIADAENLTRWTSAFKRVQGEAATLETPQGAVDIRLTTIARQEARTVDWKMTFPDGSVGAAFSRVTPDGDTRSIYSFVLMAPPVPLEALEGALEAQRVTLAEELVRLKGILEGQ
jgi:G3E family GTPase